MSVMRQLRALDKTEPINSFVRMAVDGVEANPMNLSPLQALYNIETPFSQRNVVAILRAILRLRCGGSLGQLIVLIEGMRWLQATGVQQRHAAEMEICRSHFDLALSKHHEIVIDAGRTTEEWWMLVADVASLAFDTEPFDACVKHDGQWGAIQEQLFKVVHGSATGKSVFGDAFKSVERETMENIIKNKCIELSQCATIDLATIAKVRAEFIEQASLVPVNVHEPFPTSKTMLITYRGRWCEISTTSYLDLFHSARMATVKGVAVDQQKLLVCLCENDLVPMPRPVFPGKVDDALLVTFSIARSQVNDFVSELEDQSGENINTMFKSKTGILRTMDKHIVIEHSFFEAMAGEFGQACFMDAVLAKLPGNEVTDLTWARSKAAIDELLKTPFAKFCGKGIFSQAQTVGSWLASGEADRMPSCANAASDFLKKARDKLANFFHTLNEDEVMVFGKRALDIIFETVSKKRPEDINLGDVKELMIFKWLCSVDQAKQVDEWTEKALSTSAAPSKRPVETAQKKRKSTGKAALNAAASAAKVVDAYFD